MYKYYVIIVHDDNSIYKVYKCKSKRDVQKIMFYYADSCFVTCVISSDCFKYSENNIIIRAKSKEIIEA